MRVLVNKQTRVIEGIDGDGREADPLYIVAEVPDKVMYQPGRKILGADGTVQIEAPPAEAHAPMDDLSSRLAGVEARLAALEGKPSR